MRVAPDNPGEAQEPDVDMPQRKLEPHKINLPVSQMGQDHKGIMPNEQDTVKRGSPETEGSLSLLGAGSAYNPPYVGKQP